MRRGLPLTLALAALGCATPVDVVVPEIASPISQQVPQDLGRGVEEQIEDSLPTVSYAVEAPDTGAAAALDATRSLDPDAVRDLIRRLDSLDGGGVIVCVPTGGTAFGECVFPLPEDGP